MFADSCRLSVEGETQQMLRVLFLLRLRSFGQAHMMTNLSDHEGVVSFRGIDLSDPHRRNEWLMGVTLGVDFLTAASKHHKNRHFVHGSSP